MIQQIANTQGTNINSLLQSSFAQASNIIQQNLNNAVQSGRQAVQLQAKQEQSFLNERQRAIKNDQTERFNMQDRIEFALGFEENKRRNKLMDQGRSITNQQANENLKQSSLRNQFENAQMQQSIEESTTKADFAKLKKERDGEVFQSQRNQGGLKKELTKAQIERTKDQTTNLKAGKAGKASKASKVGETLKDRININDNRKKLRGEFMKTNNRRFKGDDLLLEKTAYELTPDVDAKGNIIPWEVYKGIEKEENLEEKETNPGSFFDNAAKMLFQVNPDNASEPISSLIQ